MTENLDQNPAESLETQALSTEAKEEAAPSEALSRLQADLEGARTESEQWRDRFLRKAAELENYRKRAEKEKIETSLSARGAVLGEFLQVIDGFERALASLDGARAGDEGLGQYHEGIELLHKQMMDTLQRLGVTPLQTTGQPFDPHLHEALSRLERSDHEENTVVQELRRGYLFKDRLLRPAQVVVSTRPRNVDTSEA